MLVQKQMLMVIIMQRLGSMGSNTSEWATGDEVRLLASECFNLILKRCGSNLWNLTSTLPKECFSTILVYLDKPSPSMTQLRGKELGTSLLLTLSLLKSMLEIIIATLDTEQQTSLFVHLTPDLDGLGLVTVLTSICGRVKSSLPYVPESDREKMYRGVYSVVQRILYRITSISRYCIC